MATGSYELMRETYLSWPRLLRESFEAGVARAETHRLGGFSSIVVCGMGGSGIVGDYLASLSEEAGSLPVYTVKGFEPPRWASSSLTAVVSFSGNTIETLECYRVARSIGSKIVVVTHDGRLLEAAERDGVPAVRVPGAPAARLALAQLLGGLLGFLDGLGALNARGQVEETARLLEEAASDALEEARRISSIAGRRTPVFIACRGFEALAVRAKNEVNENAKTIAWYDFVPEWGHNSIEGWGSMAGLAVIGFDPGFEPCSSLVSYVLEVASSSGAVAGIVKLRGSGRLAKLFWGSLVVGLASLELALARGVDPLETGMIREYRRRIERLIRGEST